MPRKGRSPGAAGELAGMAALRRQLDEAGPAAAYLLLGDDRQAADRALSLIVERTLDPGAGGAGGQRLDGDAHSFADVADACATRPLFGGRRLLVVREPEALSGDAEPLLAWLRAPSPDATLVLAPRRFDGRLTVSRQLVALARVVHLDPPAARDLGRFIEAELGERGLAAEPEAVQLLRDLVDADTLALGGELDKLALYCAGRPRATAGDVAAVVGRTRAMEAWALSNAIEDGEAAAAVAALRRLLAQGAAVPLLVAVLDGCLGRLTGSDANPAPPWRQAAVNRRQRDLAGRLAELYGLLLVADRSFRTTGGDAPAALESLVLAATSD